MPAEMLQDAAQWTMILIGAVTLLIFLKCIATAHELFTVLDAIEFADELEERAGDGIAEY